VRNSTLIVCSLKLWPNLHFSFQVIWAETTSSVFFWHLILTAITFQNLFACVFKKRQFFPVKTSFSHSHWFLEISRVFISIRYIEGI
jgi:hypothetical protein